MGRWRKPAYLVIALVLAVSVAAIWTWQERRGLAEQMIVQALAERGIAPVSFTVSFVGLRSIAIADLAIGPPGAPDVAVDSLSVSYSLGELMSGRVRAIEVGEARGRVGFSEDGLSLGSLDPLLKGAGAGGPLQVPPVQVARADIVLDTPRGTVAVTGPLSIQPDGDSFEISTGGVLIREAGDAARIASLHAEGKARISSAAIQLASQISTADGERANVPLIGIEGEYDVVARQGSLRGEGSLSLARDGTTIASLVPALAPYYIDLTGEISYRGEARLDGEAVSATGEADMRNLALRQTAAGDARMSGRLRFAAETGGSAVPARLDLDGIRVEDISSPERFAPVTIEGPVTMSKRRIEAKFVARSAVPSIRGARLANIDGLFDFIKGEANVNVTADLAFAPGKLELQTVLPMLGGSVSQMSGALAYSAQAKLSSKGLSTSGKARLDNLGFAASSVTARGVSGEVDLKSLLPPATNGVQTLTIRELDAGVPLESGTVSFELDRAGLRIVDASWPYADGKLALASHDTSALADEAAFLLTVENVDLGILLEVADIPGLRATGHIAGSIPLVIRNGEPVLVDGVLAAQENGIIVYQGEAGAAVQTEQTKLLTDALKNFHYTALSGGLSGNANGEVVLRLSLRGSNPDLYEGYPFAINVNVEGSLADLFRRGTVGFRPLELIKQNPDMPDVP
jgi:hypothetical protein